MVKSPPPSFTHSRVTPGPMATSRLASRRSRSPSPSMSPTDALNETPEVLPGVNTVPSRFTSAAISTQGNPPWSWKNVFGSNMLLTYSSWLPELSPYVATAPKSRRL